MKLVRGSRNILSRYRQCVATIGNFDGCHLGHQAVFAQLKSSSNTLSLPVTVMVFEPQPQEYFRPEAAPARLTRWREKFQIFRSYGVDQMVCLRFDARLAALSPQAFVQDLLVKALGVRYLVVGEDFRFGKDRQGDFSLLEAMGLRHGFEVIRAQTFKVDGRRVSSTWVRQALASGDMEMARRLLGRYYSISGRIAHGKKRGRSLGFPTANIALGRAVSAVAGIFAARVIGLTEQPLPAVAYIATCLNGGSRQTILEVYVFDFDQDCYGHYVSVELIRKIRDDATFDSDAELQRQIAIDAGYARKILTRIELQTGGVS